MESVVSETFQNFMEGNDFNPMIALAIASGGKRAEAEKVLDETPAFKTKILESLKTMFQGLEPEEVLEMIMAKLGTENKEEKDGKTKKEKMGETLSSILDITDDMDGFRGERYATNMKLINNFAIIETLKTLYHEKELLESRPDAPKRLLRSIFYKKIEILRRVDDDGEISPCRWVHRDKDKIEKENFELIQLLMNLYLSAIDLDLPEDSEITREDITLEDDMVETIQDWLESNGSMTKSSRKQ